MELAEFFEQTAPPLVRLCFLTTLDREAAADAAQEALSRAWRNWHRVGADSSDRRVDQDGRADPLPQDRSEPP